eukprot:54739-Chlamydomonas_euryale.AAC.2
MEPRASRQRLLLQQSGLITCDASTRASPHIGARTSESGIPGSKLKVSPGELHEKQGGGNGFRREGGTPEGSEGGGVGR